MGHRVPDHGSLCRNIHGHRYKAELVIEGPVIEAVGDPERGMVADFSWPKQILSTVLEYWDHGLMLSTSDPWLSTLRELKTKIIEVEFIPTAERIAQDLFESATLQQTATQIKVVEVTVWETPNCKATYRGE